MTYWGNELVAQGYGSTPTLDGASDTSSYRFTAQASKTVAQVRISVYSLTGTSPTYRIGLQGDSAGDPDGSWLGTNAYVDMQLAAGENICNITDASITASTVYHLVVEYQSGTIDGSNYVRLRNNKSDPLHTRNLIYPYDGAADTNLAVLFSSDGGSSWGIEDVDFCPAFILDYDDATYAGQPIDDRSEQKVYGITAKGQVFTVPSNKSVTAVRFFIKKNGSPAALTMSLYNQTDTVYLFQDEAVDTSGVTTSYAWLTHTFAATESLVTGKTYKLWIISTGSDSSNYWYIQMSTARPNNSVWNDLTWQDTTGCYITGGVVPGGTNTNDDFTFRFTEAVAGGDIQLIVDGGVQQLIVDAGVIQKIVD